MPNKAKPIKKTAKKAALGRGLGRGLGSLLGGPGMEEPRSQSAPEQNPLKQALNEVKPTRPVQAQVADTARIWKVQIDKIVANENQPRKAFAPEALKELAASIKEKGIFQPIVARKLGDGRFEIIAGERRWRAAQQAGLHEVPIILRKAGDQDALEMALIENIQREDLNVIEEAEAYQYLMNEYGLTQQDLAEKVGKERATIANVLRLLNLTESVRNMVAFGQLSLGQAKVILSIEEPKLQKKLAMKVKDDKLTVRQTEKLVKKLTAQSAVAAEIEEMDVSGRLMKGLSEELQKMIGTKVTIDYSKGKGKVSIHFYSDDELNQVVDKLRNSWQS